MKCGQIWHIGVPMRRRQSGLYNVAKAHKEVGKLYNNNKKPEYKMDANFHHVIWHPNIFEKKKKKTKNKLGL